MHLPIISALCGLVGALGNNGKTNNTDAVIVTAILKLSDETLSEEQVKDSVDEIHKEKFQISPNCATCPTPCGNTSDYDLKRLEAGSAELKQTKEKLLEALIQAAKGFEQRKEENPEKMDTFCRAIMYFSYDLSTESYENVIAELKTM